MKNACRVELRKALRSRWFLLILLAGIAITLLNTREVYVKAMHDIAMDLSLDEAYNHRHEWVYLSVFSGWIGQECVTSGYALFIFIYPMLATLAYGWSYCRERNSGYARQMVVRCGRTNYYFAKYLATFCAGGLAVTVPLAFNFILAMTYQTAARPDGVFLYFAYYETGFLGSLFYESPFLAVFLYLFVDFLFCGAVACLSFALACFIRRTVLVLVFPFLGLLAWNYVFYAYLINEDSFYNYSLIKMIHPGTQGYDTNGLFYLASIAVLILVTLYICVADRRKRDVL